MSDLMYFRDLEKDSPYLTDESKMTGHGDVLFIPDEENEIKDLLKRSNSIGRKITISSMRTGVCGGAVPDGGDVLSMERFKNIIGIGENERGFFLRVQSAVTINEINDILRKKYYDSLLELTDNAKERARASDLFYPIDPTELNGSVGGNVSTNASGPRTFKYGPTRNWIKRIKVILSNGDVLDLERGKYIASDGILTLSGRTIRVPTYDFRTGIKNVTGIMSGKTLDAVDLFIGSEGIFGVVTEVDVYLASWHPLMSNIMFFPTNQDAYDFVKDLVNSEIIPEFVEYFDSGSLDLIRASKSKDPRFTGMPDIPGYAGSAIFFDLPYDDKIVYSYRAIGVIASKYSGSLKNSWCGHELVDRKRFFDFRHSVPQSIFEYVASIKGDNPGIHKMGTDMCVPLENLDEMMSEYETVLSKYSLEYVIFGHIGNGHLHVEIILKNMDDYSRAKVAYSELAVKAIELGGSPSAEHGIGKIKTNYIGLMYGNEGIEAISAIKDVLDPEWILCPGNMVVR